MSLEMKVTVSSEKKVGGFGARNPSRTGELDVAEPAAYELREEGVSSTAIQPTFFHLITVAFISRLNKVFHNREPCRRYSPVLRVEAS